MPKLRVICQKSKVSVEKKLILIMDKLRLNSLSRFEDRIKRIPRDTLKFNLKSCGVAKSDLSVLVQQSFTKGKMDNNIVDLIQDQICVKFEIIY